MEKLKRSAMKKAKGKNSFDFLAIATWIVSRKNIFLRNIQIWIRIFGIGIWIWGNNTAQYIDYSLLQLREKFSSRIGRELMRQTFYFVENNIPQSYFVEIAKSKNGNNWSHDCSFMYEIERVNCNAWMLALHAAKSEIICLRYFTIWQNPIKWI